VKSKEVFVSQDELLALSKNPIFAVRSIMNREVRGGVRKGLCKKKYSDIGKEEVDWKIVEEAPLKEEHARVMKEAEWQGVRSELVYDL
jgi:hypothetical protein